MVARWGGDEFVILHHHAPGQLETHDLAKLIIDEINRAVVIDGSEVIVGASIGSASAPNDGLSPDALLSKADIALYAAKSDGRRVWRAFEQEMDAKIQIRRLIELELRAAVATEGIEVYFQPIVSVATRRIVGFEALARWRSALLGPVSPAEFIPIVEEIGLMEEMGAAVLRRACKACAGWPDEVCVSVNLSSTQFRSGNLEKTILGALAAANLAPERLDLEITELILLEDRGDTRRTLQALRAQGLRISLDDFGTGYSSLSYLLSFPLDRIKIDRSFTMGLGIQERASVLVEGVSAMSGRLGMTRPDRRRGDGEATQDDRNAGHDRRGAGLPVQPAGPGKGRERPSRARLPRSGGLSGRAPRRFLTAGRPRPPWRGTRNGPPRARLAGDGSAWPVRPIPMMVGVTPRRPPPVVVVMPIVMPMMPVMAVAGTRRRRRLSERGARRVRSSGSKQGQGFSSCPVLHAGQPA